jgi:hypothetical protein
MMDTKPLIDDKLRGSTFDEIEELKVSHFGGGGGAATRARDSLLLDGLPDSMGRFKTSPENQFKSLYSFQTFKWLIFQA